MCALNERRCQYRGAICSISEGVWEDEAATYTQCVCWSVDGLSI